MRPDSRLFSLSPGRVQPIGRLWPPEDSPEMERLHADFHAVMERRSRHSGVLIMKHGNSAREFVRREVEKALRRGVYTMPPARRMRLSQSIRRFLNRIGLDL